MWRISVSLLSKCMLRSGMKQDVCRSDDIQLLFRLTQPGLPMLEVVGMLVPESFAIMRRHQLRYNNIILVYLSRQPGVCTVCWFIQIAGQ
jgi:hypothetical protein